MFSVLSAACEGAHTHPRTRWEARARHRAKNPRAGGVACRVLMAY